MTGAGFARPSSYRNDLDEGATKMEGWLYLLAILGALAILLGGDD